MQKRKIVIRAVILVLCLSCTILPTHVRAEETVAGIGVALSNATDKDIEITMLSLLTNEDIEILQKITEAECEGKSKGSKMNVVSTIINRLNDDKFPSTVHKVVFQKDQFTSIDNKRYWSVKVTQETIDAVNEVISNGCTHDSTYFFNLDYVTSSKIKRWIKEELEFDFKDDAGHSYYTEKCEVVSK